MSTFHTETSAAVPRRETNAKSSTHSRCVRASGIFICASTNRSDSDPPPGPGASCCSSGCRHEGATEHPRDRQPGKTETYELIPQNKELVPQNKELVPQNKELVPQNKVIRLSQNNELIPQNKELVPQNKELSGYLKIMS